MHNQVQVLPHHHFWPAVLRRGVPGAVPDGAAEVIMTTTATSTLRHEHEAIQKMLDAAEEAARRIDGGVEASSQILSGLLEFLRIFADQCHHGKEEDLLFPLLEQKGLPRAGGPIGVMLAEHEQGRSLIRRMAAALDAFSTGKEDAAHQWAQAAHDYVALLRAHIEKENNVLFVMAERLLSGKEQEDLSAAFEKLELEKMGAGTHERLHRLMEKLEADIFSGTGHSPGQ
jgi:hemerythrin-like domain-containing protein